MKRTFPADFDGLFADLRASTKQRLDEIIQSLDQSDHGLLTNATRIAGRIDLEARHLEEKVFQAHRKKNQTVRAKIEQLAYQLYPSRQLQERVFSVNYFVAKYGFWIINYLYDMIDCHSDVHHLIYLDRGESEDA